MGTFHLLGDKGWYLPFYKVADTTFITERTIFLIAILNALSKYDVLVWK